MKILIEYTNVIKILDMRISIIYYSIDEFTP